MPKKEVFIIMGYIFVFFLLSSFSCAAEDEIIADEIATNLFNRAVTASEASYSPYSKFPVGAAVLTKSGKVFLVTNVENASYELTICAERVALCNAVTAGHRDIEAIAIFAKKGEVMPCDACRQFILEFGKNIKVIYKQNGKLMVTKANDLISRSFPKKKLK